MQFIKREIAPHDIKVAGNIYPAIFNYRAITLAEDVSKIANGYTLARLADEYDDKGNLKRAGEGDTAMIIKAGLDASEVIGLLYGMLVAAGVEVGIEDLKASVSPQEMPEIIKQIKEIIKYQDVEDDIENSKNK